MREPSSIALLCVGTLAIPVFVYWVHRQVKASKPALIPNSFWRNSSFSSICGTIALSFAVLNSIELFTSLLYALPSLSLIVHYTNGTPASKKSSISPPYRPPYAFSPVLSSAHA